MADTRVLDGVPPFRFLPIAARDALCRDLVEHSFADGEVIIWQGDDDDRVFVIESGSVETRDASRSPPVAIGRIDAGHYFGERAALFGERRAVEVRSVGNSRVFSMSAARFLGVVADSSVFAQALGDILRDKQGVFAAFDELLAELEHSVARGDLRFRELLPLYLSLVPALHPYAHDPDVVDWGALSYAVRRLPANVTRTFAYFLTDNLPERYREPAASFKAVATPARPRSTYEMVPGKSMVLIRDGLSDLVDFVTCLCLYAIEVRKIRKRLARPEVLPVLEEVAGLQVGTSDAERGSRDLLARLPFAEDEIERILELWPVAPVSRLREIEAHHEDFALHVTKQRGNYNSRHSELWSAQIARATRELMSTEPSALPHDVQVHIMSSNTHSVTNCLSAFLVAHAEEILGWARRVGHRLATESWANPMDLVYVLARDWEASNPEMADARARADERAGILELCETAFTGIEVELIDTSRLVAAGPIDPDVTAPGQTRALIVNIDFAFGQQAEEIIGTLVSLFGERIASVNVLGKAGGLVGNRGDVLVPTRFIEQSTEAIHPLSSPSPAARDRLRERLGRIGLHVGPMLTVTGTLLQNRAMLQFYRRLWDCVGLEMEGANYHRKLFESIELGVLRRDVPLRYFYYVSDLPLDHQSNLSGRMHPREGVPPLYAITRETLSAILGAH